MSAHHSEHQFSADDGAQLFAHRWLPDHGAPRAELLILHGYAEHGGRYRELAHRLADFGMASTAIDFRGHGRSRGQRGYVDRFEEYFLDLEAAQRLLSPGLPQMLLAHSHGALIALDYVTRNRSSFRAMVISNPYLALAMEVPAYKRTVAKLAARFLPRLSLPSGLPPEGVSRDPGIVDAYQRDPLVFTTAAAGWFAAATAAQARVRALTSLPLPCLYVVGEADPIASPVASRALANNLASDHLTLRLCAGARHEVFNEIDRATLHTEVGQWLLSHL